MTTLIAVLKDLWNFCFGGSVTPPSTIDDTKNNSNSSLTLNLARPSLISEEAVTFSPAPQIIATSLPNKEAISPYGEKAYIAVPKANVFLRPVWSYDGVLIKLSYAEPVQILGYEGRFARISVFDKFGFILKDELTSSQVDILPLFQTVEIYSANHPDTKKLRKITNDEFFASEMFLPLQAVEFVNYRLFAEGRKILWPDIRPRLAGSWQNLLRGRLGIQIGVLPKTGAVIEYNKPDGTGFVGYTKSVHVDESIVIEGVGRLIEGEYREEAISKEEWHEWRPIWIAVS
jgi:hypothetical protein